MERESVTGVVFSEIDEQATEALLAVDEAQPATVESKGEAGRVARNFPKKRYEAKKRAQERKRRATK